MRASHIALLTVLALILGIATGWFISGHFYSGVFTKFFASTAFVDVNDAYSTLKALRAGEVSEATDLLEARMDGDLMVLGTLLEDIAPEDREPTRIRLLSLVKEYRDDYPRSTDEPEIDEAVDEALALSDDRSQE